MPEFATPLPMRRQCAANAVGRPGAPQGAGSVFLSANHRMKIQSQKDFFAGLLFAAAGSAFALGATRYSIGTAARMGPGYFPLALGVLLALLGVAIAVKALVARTPDGDPVGRWGWRPLFFVLMGNVVFGVLLAGLPGLGVPAMGLVVAIYGLTFVAALGSAEFNAREVFVLATVLAAGSCAAFVWALKLQFAVWPAFITG